MAGGSSRRIFAGFAGGAPDPPASSVDDYAADVIDLLDSLHIKDAVIGGLSLGGYVAFALFRRAPRYVRGLILADTRSQADTPEGVENRKRMLKLLADKQESGPAAVVDEMLPKLLGAGNARRASRTSPRASASWRFRILRRRSRERSAR